MQITVVYSTHIVPALVYWFRSIAHFVRRSSYYVCLKAINIIVVLFAVDRCMCLISLNLKHIHHSGFAFVCLS